EFIDIYPTLTDLAGIDGPKQLAGISLAKHLSDDSLPARSAVFPRYHSAEAVHTDEYTLTQWFGADKKVKAQMLYDNKNDPDETRNLASNTDYKSVLRDLSKQLATHIKTRK
ncbi:MAG: DUF4976 domain-containing protein, partial [Pseudomonadales bacterium]|nr:DUF4976 domain-containing protein [Pseudomonadales bacterium]